MIGWGTIWLSKMYMDWVAFKIHADCKTWIPWLFFDEIVETDESSPPAPSPPLFAPPAVQNTNTKCTWVQNTKYKSSKAYQMIINNDHKIILFTKNQNHKIMCFSFVLTLSDSKFSRSPWSPDSGASASSGTNSLLDSRALLKGDSLSSRTSVTWHVRPIFRTFARK